MFLWKSAKTSFQQTGQRFGFAFRLTFGAPRRQGIPNRGLLVPFNLMR